jgi:hypothetical protein
MAAKISQQPRLRRSTRSRLPSAQGGIRGFTKAAKPGATAIATKEKAVSLTTSSKKRKLDESKVHRSDEEASPAVDTTEVKLPKVRKLNKSAAAPSSTAARRSERRTRLPPPSPSSSLSRASSVDASSTPDCTETSLSSLPSSFLSDQSDTPSPTLRPTSFDDLISLHSAFLAALSIHFAHNGASTPADIGSLCLHTEKIWKKRKITIRDIQRIVHILGGGSGGRTASQELPVINADFRIADHGHGKVCLEIPDVPDKAGYSMPFDEALLSEIFARNLERLWQQRTTEIPQSESSVDQFMEDIPLAPIHNSVSTFNPLRKGQLRLQDLKAGVIIVKAERESRAAKALEISKLKRSAKEAEGRNIGLLERVKNKEEEQSKQPPPPSKDVLLRQSAAQRIEDVAGVLVQMRPSGSTEMDSSNKALVRRKPYKLANVVQNIQDSTGSPISKQEIEICIEILAQPSVAGNWVSIIAMGKLKSVVLKSGDNVSPRDIALKVAEQGEA